MSRLPVLLASDFPMLRDSMAKLLGSVPELQIVASTDVEAEVLRLAQAHNPSVAVLDLNVEWSALCELVTNLASRQVSPLLMNDKLDEIQTVELLRCGMCGVIPRRSTPEILSKSVRAIGSGEIWITRRAVGKLVEQVQTSHKGLYTDFTAIDAPKPAASQTSDQMRNRYSLTRREMQMVQALAEGMTNKDIAGDFGISESTVKHHLTSIFDKVGVHSRLELATFAAYHGLVGVSASPKPAA